MKNLILDKYIEVINKLLSYLKDDNFWIIFNQDEENEYSFYVASSQFDNFDWGVIILNELQQGDSLLDTDILYLIPRLQNSKSNIKNSQTSLKSKFSSNHRCWWTFEFIKMMNSWIVASLFYSFYHLSQSDITWKIKLAQKIDAWLFATFVYESFGLNTKQLTNIFNKLDINNTL